MLRTRRPKERRRKVGDRFVRDMDHVFGRSQREIRDKHTPEELWDDATPTRSDECRYHYGCDCWIQIKGAKIEPYMRSEQREGRVVTDADRPDDSDIEWNGFRWVREAKDAAE